MLNLIRNDSEESRSMVDCTVLVDSIKEGKKIMEILTSHEKQIKVTTTFVTNNRGKTYDDRRKKLAFWKGSPKIKISTLQSFKGWEGRMIIVNMTSFKTIKQKTLFYTGLTRLKKHINGSFMTVVSSDRTIEGFAKDLAKQKILPFISLIIREKVEMSRAIKRRGTSFGNFKRNLQGNSDLKQLWC